MHVHIQYVHMFSGHQKQLRKQPKIARGATFNASLTRGLLCMDDGMDDEEEDRKQHANFCVHDRRKALF